jgi:hypothetical protein
MKRSDQEATKCRSYRIVSGPNFKQICSFGKLDHMGIKGLGKLEYQNFSKREFRLHTISSRSTGQCKTWS